MQLFNQVGKRRYLERYHFEAGLDLYDRDKVAHVSRIFGEDVLTIEPKSFTLANPR